MTQISRPFQIGLLAVGLFAAVWFFALQGHSSSSGGSSSSASAPHAAAAPPAKASGSSASASASGSSSADESAAAPSSVYHGSAPGVEGLTRAIARAHEAVATARLSEKHLAEKSAQASSPTASGTAGASAPGSTPTTATSPAVPKASTTTHAVTVHAKSAPTKTKPVTAPKVASSPAGTPSTASAKSVPPMQATVEAELKQGKMVAILFWNSKASVDRVVQKELQVVRQSLGGKLAVHDARAVQVTSFGSITRDVQVSQTPTILIVNRRAQATSLTGLTDSFAIEQAIVEARHA